MRIVFGMAAHAGHVELAAEAVVALVARGAGGAAMAVGERKIGLSVMVEFPQRPVADAVTLGAVLTQGPLVLIVITMAGDAILAFAAIGRVEVAGLALFGEMRADQGEVSAGMVEGGFFPIDITVTVGALLAEQLLVRIFIGVAIDAIARRTARPRWTLDAILVAVRAFRLGMGVVQGKFGIPIVLETARIPLPGGMAVTTLFAEATLMRVVFAMAGHARGRRVVEVFGIRMTTPALGIAMGAVQRELGLVVAELWCTVPTCGVMTVSTGLAQAAAMRVVLGVATGTVLFQSTVVGRAAMAVHASDLLVLAEQSESGIAMVIARLSPIALGMAGRAVVVHRPFVGVVIAMTGHTLRIQRDLGGGLDMAVGADHVSVLAQQIESGQCVVELGLQPVVGNVACRTVLIETVLVRIVVAMTRDASRRCFPVGPVRRVAIDAFSLGVASDQGEIGLGMIKAGLVELGDPCVAPLVVGMTGSTLGLRQASVHALTGIQIMLDLVVAVGAQRSLSRLIEGEVATITFVFVLRVPRDDLSGHQRTLDNRGLRAAHAELQAEPQHSGNEGRGEAYGLHGSVHVHGEHVNESGDDQDHHQRQVQHMPQREQSLGTAELRGAHRGIGFLPATPEQGVLGCLG